MNVETRRKSKVPAVRVASDDCTIMVGRVVRDGVVAVEGTPYRVHEGEWVEIVPVQSMREALALAALANMDTSGGDAATRQRSLLSHLVDPMETLCEELSKRLTAWSWTDNAGEPMAQPHGCTDVIKQLGNDELLWLLSAAQGETGAQLKNGSTP